MSKKHSSSSIVAAPPMYTRQDYEILRQERRRMADLIATMEAAEACGVACNMYKTMREQIESQLAAIEEHFMTPPPK